MIGKLHRTFGASRRECGNIARLFVVAGELQAQAGVPEEIRIGVGCLCAPLQRAGANL